MSEGSVEESRARTNIRDVAALAGVSISAVSLALNGKPGVAPAKRARVLQVVEELGFDHTLAQPGPVGTEVLGLLMDAASGRVVQERCTAEIVAGIVVVVQP